MEASDEFTPQFGRLFAAVRELLFNHVKQL